MLELTDRTDVIFAYLILASALTLTTVAGLPVLAAVPAELRSKLAPAAPVLGACALSLLMHWFGAVLPSQIAVPIVLVLVVAGVAMAVRARRLVSLRALAPLLVGFVLAAVPVVLAMRPLDVIDVVRLVQPAQNNDAFSYVTVAEWLEDHPALDLPEEADFPAFGYAHTHIDVGVRLGEEFLQTAVAQINGRDTASSWYPTTIAWLALLPGVVAALCGLLGLNRWVGVAGGFGISMTAVVASQVFNQNSAALLGVAVAPITLALLVATIGDQFETPPPWLTGFAVAGLASIYSEYLPVLFPVVALFLVMRKPGRLRDAFFRLIPVAIVAASIAPLVTYNVARSLSLQSGIVAPGVQSYFIHAPGGTIAARLAGTAFMEQEVTWNAGTVAVLVVLAAASLFGLLDRRVRGVVASVMLGVGAIILYLTAIHRFPYGQQRAVQVGWPVVLLAVVIGVDLAVRWARSTDWRSLRALVGLPIVLGAVSVVAVDGVAQARYDVAPTAKARHIDADLLEGVQWVKDVGGPDGEMATVVETSFFQQLWVTYELRDRQQIAYPFLYPDYLRRSSSNWDGQMRRFVLVGRDTYVAAEPGVVVMENDRFRMLDLSRGEAVVTIVGLNWGAAEPGPEGPAHWMGDDGRLHLLRSAGAPRTVTLNVVAASDLAPMPLDVVTDDNLTLASAALPSSVTGVALSLPDRPTTTVVLHNGKPAQPPVSVPDPRFLSVYLQSVTAAF